MRQFLHSQLLAGLIVVPLLAISSAADAASSKLLATGGATQIEGSAGGGLVPWAFITGLESSDEIGASVFYTKVSPQDFDLASFGLAVGLYDRVELSIARQQFSLGTTVPGESIRMDTAGIKVKLAGDAIFASNAWLPQIAAGTQYKKNLDYDFVPKLLGARDAAGFDFYVAATKVYLDGVTGRTVLLDATLRATRANQLGILGFGGDSNAYTVHPEVSTAVFLTDSVIFGAEYRSKPDNLRVFKEDAFADAFVAWLPCKSLAFVVAYADLGNIADKKNQHGLYGSAQISF